MKTLHGFGARPKHRGVRVRRRQIRATALLVIVGLLTCSTAMIAQDVSPTPADRPLFLLSAQYSVTLI